MAAPPMNDMAKPLSDLKVLDFSNSVAGAMATMVLADYGAAVTKIEPPEGDRLCHHRAAPMWYRGKTSLRLDLKQEAGRRRSHELAGEADLVVETFRPGVAERLGIGYADLGALNPRLVYCAISAFGAQGPLAGYKAYEHTVLARAGKMGDAALFIDREGPAYFAVP